MKRMQPSTGIMAKLREAFDSPFASLSEIVGLFLPRLGENFSLVLLSLLNLGISGSLGIDALNAVGLVEPIHMIVQYCYIAFGIAASVFVSQYMGAAQPDMVAKSFVRLTRMTMLFSIAVSALLVLVRKPLLYLLYPNANAQTLQYAQVYFIGMLGTGPLHLMSCLACGLLRSIGRAGKALNISVMLNGLGYLFNLLLIRVLHYDFVCMAWSVGIARVITFFYLVRFLAFPKIRVMPFDWSGLFRREPALDKQIRSVSVAFALENAIFQSGKLIVQMIAVQLGVVAATVNTVTLSLMNYIQCPGNSMADISVTILGRCIGGEDEKSARKYTGLFHRSASACNLVFFLITLAMFQPLMTIFHVGAEAVHLVFVSFLMIGVANVLVWPRGFLVANCLKAGGDIRFTTRVSILLMWALRVMLAYVLCIPLHMGVLGIATAMCVEWTVRAIIFSLRYQSEAGFSHRIL